MKAGSDPGDPGGAHYRAEIDGLRALAIGGVVAHHAGLGIVPGGFTGVDVFFVISGYLITGIVAAEMDAGRFSPWRFVERRIRRIVPALAAMLCVSCVAAFAILTPEDFRPFAQSLTAASLFASNLLFTRQAGYFDSAEGMQVLLHTWTLGVEEQFYLVFPLVLIACVRWRRQAMLPVVAGLGLLSFALALWLAETWPRGSFYLLPSRLWEFAVGAGIALLARRPAPRLLPALGGLALIAAGYALIRPGTPAPGAMFLLPTLGTALVILFAAPANAAGRVLAWRPFVWLGLVSFGTYLWHQPLLVFARYLWFGPLPLPVLAGLVAGSVGLGALSYHLLEQPVRAGRLLASRPALLWAAAAGLAVPAAAGVAGHFRWLLPASGPEMERLGALQFEDPGPEVVPPNGPLPYVLFGDSHAAHYRHALAERFGAGALLSQPSCLAAPGVSHAREELDPARCRELPDRLVRLVRERGVRTVIWSQLWARQIFAEGAREPLSLEAGAKALTGGMQHLADRLPQGTRIILIGNVPGAWPAGPQVAGGWPRCRAYLNAQCPAAFPTRKAQGKAINAALRAFAARDRRFIYVDSAAPLCPGDRCLVLQDGALNYWDPHHLTLAGARRVVATMPALPPATLP